MEEANLISETYVKYHDEIFTFIAYRTKDYEIAADMAQDVFLRLLNQKQMLCKTTIKSFIYTIAKNLVIDYFRHRAKNIEFVPYTCEIYPNGNQLADSKLCVENIERLEALVIKKMPAKRQRIYTLSRQDGLKTKEIAEKLNMEKHAVEFQLYLGRKIMREYLSKVCI